MLVLSRYPNEVIKIGNDISVTVVEVKGDRVALGVEAPRDVPIDRLEIYARKHGKTTRIPGVHFTDRDENE